MIFEVELEELALQCRDLLSSELDTEVQGFRAFVHAKVAAFLREVQRSVERRVTSQVEAGNTCENIMDIMVVRCTSHLQQLTGPLTHKRTKPDSP